jgi:hypothetical protein
MQVKHSKNFHNSISVNISCNCCSICVHFVSCT